MRRPVAITIVADTSPYHKTIVTGHIAGCSVKGDACVAPTMMSIRLMMGHLLLQIILLSRSGRCGLINFRLCHSTSFGASGRPFL